MIYSEKRKIVLNNLFSTHKQKKTKSKFTFIDLFAGIGGIRMGFEDIGGECVFTSEWDESAKKTYQENFKEIPYGDITKIEPEEIPKFDLLLAGFPCQPFSQAGLKKGFDDTRGTLFFDILRIIKHHKPKVVFLENVRNLATHDKGNTLKVIIRNLEKSGYTVYYDLFNAKDFGVPQNRVRIYIIAFKNKINFEFPKPPQIETTLGQILEKKVDDKYTISDKLWVGH
jgi:DNA (cytosine-5)-methyltransferase 1